MLSKISISSFIMMFLLCQINAQVTTKLANIIVGDPNNSSGLGYSFQGSILSDGYLYFRGSGNGLQQAIWKTKGTAATSSKVIEETNIFGSEWDYFSFMNEGVLVQKGNTSQILEAGKTSFRNLSTFPAASIDYFEPSGDGRYYFTTSVGNMQVLYSTDLYNDTKMLGEFHPNQSSLHFTAGIEGAVIYNPNSFVQDFPKIYLKKENSIMDVNEYLAQWFTVSDLTYAYIIDKFLIVSFKDNNNFFRNKIINMDSKAVNDFSFTRKLIKYFTHNDDIYLVTESAVVKINRNTMENKVVYDEVYAFTPTIMAEDKIYIIGEGNTGLNSIIQLDLTIDKANVLDNAPTGESFYSNKFAFHQGSFYYIQNTPTNQLLNKYNFVTNTTKVIDTLSYYTGAIVEHALVSLGDKLVVSKRIGPFSHELYVLNNTTSTITLKQNSLSIIPNITQSSVNINVGDNTLIDGIEANLFDISGRVQISPMIRNGNLDVSTLSSGLYYGKFFYENTIYNFSFVKM